VLSTTPVQSPSGLGQAALHCPSTLAERKLLHLRRDDACANCSRTLPAGSQAYWVKTERIVLCASCGAEETPPSPATSAPGASARQIYERRRQAREDRQRERYGRIGGWAARVSAGPQHERAWAKGAAGEQENAKRLHKLLADEPVVLLHDRRIPRSRANIDHLGIGPGGVTVIDSKKLEGKVRIDWRGGLFSERRFDLYVNGRKRTKLVESVERQVEIVSTVLAEEGFAGLSVLGALCMADTEGLPLFKRLKIRDVSIAGPHRVANLIKRAGELDPSVQQQVAGVLERRLGPA
jgi:hypothetical protein